MKKILLILAFLFSIAITAQTTTTTVGTLKHNNTPPITTGNLYTIVWNETTKKFERQLISGGDTPTLQQVTTQGASTEVMTYFNNGASIFKQGLNNNGSINVNGDSLNMGSADNTTGTLGSSFDITAERTQLRSYNTDLTKNSYITSEPAIIQITSGNEYRTSFIDVLPDEVRVTGTDSFCKGLVGASDFSANYTPLSYVQKSYVDGLVSGGGAGATNISYVPSTRNIVSSTGTGAVLPIADGTNYGLSFNDYTTAEKSKLASTPTSFFNGAYGSLTGIPSTFTPSAHSHVISDVMSLQTTIDAKVTNDLTASTTVAPSKTAVNTALASKYDASNPSGYQTSAQVTSGARNAISLTTTGTIGASTYNSTTGVLNVPNYASGITAETDPLALKITNNLSDLNNVTTARTNLGLGTLATQSGSFSGTSSGTNTGDNSVNTLYSGLVSNATHTGDVTGATALTIANNVVSNAKLAQMTANTFKANNTGATANATDITPAQAKTLLAITNTDVSGLGTLSTQSGTFSGSSSGTNTGDQTSIVGITGTKAQFNTAVTDGDIQYVGDAPTAHTHTASAITDFSTASDARISNAVINALSDVVIATPVSGQVLKYNGTNWINDTDNSSVGGGVLSITGTANQVIASAATGAVTLSLPQDIATTSSPTFNTVNATKFNSGALSYSAPNAFATLQNSVNTYSQFVIQNSNSGATASSDFVVNNNNSTDTTFYGDFGINSGAFTGSGAFFQPNNVYLTATSSDLAFGTTTANPIHFVVNNGSTDAMTISSVGVVNIPNIATNGYVKSSAGNGTLSASATIPTTDLLGTLAATQFPSLTGDLTTTSGSLETTLATVNSNVGSFIGANITVDAKGRITAVSNGNTKNNVEWTNTTALGGLWTGTAGVGAGTFTSLVPTDTNLFTSIKKSNYANVVTTTNQVLGQRCNEALFFRGSSVSGAGGFSFFSRGGMTTWTNGGRFFAGMATATSVLGSNPSLLANTVGFATDDTDNGLISFITKNGTTLTKVSTGFTWASNNGYDFKIFCSPNSSQYTWEIISLQTGASVTGTATATLPVNNTKQLAFFGASNAALTPINSIQVAIAKITIETNY